MQPDFDRLPHWSRVALAAKFGRRVQPLFAEAWPEAIPARAEAIERALALAERSAAERRACDGLKDAVLGALGTAGRAQIPWHYPVPMEDDEPDAPDAESSRIASFVAKVAEKAAEAALKPDQSAGLSREAFYFARDALDAADRGGLLELLEADYEAIAASVPRPWWQFWRK